MVQKIILKLLQLICMHEWIRGAIYDSYYDYSGYHVIQYHCHCQKCGKRKIRKYYWVNKMSKEISKEKTNRLLNCPFCGGEALLRGFFFVQCIKCGVSTLTYLTEIDAIKAWNTRKPMGRIVERLEELLDKTREENSQEWNSHYRTANIGKCVGLRDAIEIVKEEGGLNE